LSRLIDVQLLPWLARTSAVLAGLIAVLIVWFLVVESLPAFRSIGVIALVSDPGWHPTEVAANGGFNLLPMVVGTLAVTAGAILLAGPLGIGCAVFGRYYAPRGVGMVFRRIVEMLAGIPSVVYGFWGLVVLAPLIGKLAPPGVGLMTGVLTLGLMILPTVALFSDAALDAVPEEVERGARALGMGRAALVGGVMLPAARNGVLTGLLLGTARAIGETMAVLMVCGNVVRYPESLFAPMRALTANIALEMGYALGDHRGALFVSGLVLVLMVIGLVALAEWLSRGPVYA